MHAGLKAGLLSPQEAPGFQAGDRNDKLLRSVATGLIECHGNILVQEGDTEYLWIADNDQKGLTVNGDYEYRDVGRGPRVVKMTLDGHPVMSLDRPDHPAYRSGTYTLTWSP